MKKKNSSVIKRADLKKIYKIFESNTLRLVGKSNFAVAVSGGSDSLALSILSKIFADKFKLKVFFYIVDHNLREESAKEALWVKKHLEKKKIKCNILTNKNSQFKRNIQCNARKIRYSLISKRCLEEKVKFLFVAHHEDDQIENFLIRLTRGSGLQGLSSMEEKSEYSEQLDIVRPLLFFKKKRLEKVTSSIFKSYVKDPSNSNDKFLRVRIRKYRKLLEQEGLDTDKIVVTIQNLKSAKNSLEVYRNRALNQYVTFSKNSNCIVSMNLILYEADEIIFRVISNILAKVSDRYYSPRGSKIINFLKNIKSKKFKKCTLGKCLIKKTGDFLLITKENI